MQKKNASVLVLSALDELAWLYNMRGSDIAYNPVFFSYSIVTLDNQILYMDEAKLDNRAREHLPSGTEIRPYETIYTDLPETISKLDASKDKIWLDSRSNYALLTAIKGDGVGPQIEDSKNPVLLAKAVKNEVEIQGFRNCHVRDAAALCHYISWLEKQLLEKQRRDLTEYDAALQLEDFRR